MLHPFLKLDNSQAYSTKWVWEESNSSKSYSNTPTPQIKSTPLDKKIWK